MRGPQRRHGTRHGLPGGGRGDGRATPFEIVEGVAYGDRVTVFVSESGTGKTFLLLDLSAAVSDGLAWHGRAVRRGSVAYISFEGDDLGLRLRALRDAGGHGLEHVHVLCASDPLSPLVDRNRIEIPSRGESALRADLDALVARLAETDQPPIVLVVVDTVRASLTGPEESSEHVSAYLRSVRRLMGSVPGAAIVLAHHSGWQDGDNKRKRERGSSAFRGNVDCTLFLEAGTHNADRGEAQLTLKTLKARDSERLAPLHLIRRRVELSEMDAHSDPVTSCVIEGDRRTREERDAESQQVVNATNRETDLAVLRVLRDHPDATSQQAIRDYASLSSTRVSQSISRILHAQWAVRPAKQRQPYTLTASGCDELEAR